MEINSKNLKWVRSEDGAIFGVCKGLAETLDLPLGLTRLALILSILFFGVGLGVYLLLAIALPRKDKVDKAMEPRVLGLCSHFAQKGQLEVGLVRFLALMMLLTFSIFTLLGYFIGYFMLPEKEKSSPPRASL